MTKSRPNLGGSRKPRTVGRLAGSARSTSSQRSSRASQKPGGWTRPRTASISSPVISTEERVAADDVAILRKLNTATKDLWAVVLTFFIGFGFLDRDGALPPDQQQLPAIPDLRDWVRSVPRQRSGWTITSMASSALCALLEG